MDETGDLLPPSQSLAAALHFLQSEWNGFARDRAKWNQHRAQLEVSFYSSIANGQPQC